MMRRLTSAPKPGPARRFVHRRDASSALVGRAYAVAHAVVAREVRARLRRGDQVVGGDAVTAVRQVDRLTSIAPCACQHLRAPSSTAARTPASTPSLDQRPRARRRERRGATVRRCACEIGHGRGRRRRVARVVSGDDAEGQRGVFDRRRRSGRSDRATTRTRSGRSESTRPYVGFKPVTPHSAAGWRIDPPVSEPSASGTRPAATAAADPPLEPPGIRSRSHGLRVTPYAEFSVDEPIANSSQLVLPTMTAPAALEALDDCRVVGREVALQDPRRRRRRHPRGADVVLEGHRHADERQVLELVPAGVDLRRAGHRALLVDMAKRVELAVGFANTVECAAADVARRARARSDGVANGPGSLVRGAHAPRTRGTLKRPAARSGVGRALQRFVARQRGARLVIAQRRAQRQRDGRSARRRSYPPRAAARRTAGCR